MDILKTAIDENDIKATYIAKLIRSDLEQVQKNQNRLKSKYNSLAHKLNLTPLNVPQSYPFSRRNNKIFNFKSISHLIDKVSTIDNVQYFGNEYDFTRSIKLFLTENISKIRLNKNLMSLIISKRIDISPKLALTLIKNSSLSEKDKVSFILSIYEFKNGGSLEFYWEVINDDTIDLLLHGFRLDKDFLCSFLSSITSKIKYGSQGQVRMIGYFLMLTGQTDNLFKLWNISYGLCCALLEKYPLAPIDPIIRTQNHQSPNELINQLIDLYSTED